jgi:hypothetical protein
MRTSAIRLATAAALLLAGLAVAAAPAAGAAKRQGERFHWSGRLAPGKTLAIRGVNGGIRAERSSGAQVVVDAEKWGRRNDPDQVVIQVEQHEDGVTICVRYPKRWGRGLTDCDGGNTNVNSDVNVEFTVQVPAGVRTAFTTVNGGITARDLAGPVRARTVNGSVHVSTTDRADVKTVNGSIVARMRPQGLGEMSFVTVNGSISLELPADARADVRARTVNGSIRSDFPVRIRGRWVGRRLDGRIGQGGPEIEMTTVNGSIALLSI